MVIQVTDESFSEQVLNSSIPVLVDFWAEWCGPCKRIAPILEEIARILADKVTITKLNVDDNTITPEKYSVHGIPTLILFINGQEAGRKIGVAGKNQLLEFINQHVEQAAS